MVIEEEDFRLVPVSETSPMFDLELLYTIKPKGKEERKEFKVVAYGLSLETALKKVAHYRTYCKYTDKAIQIITYLNAFQEELNKLKQLCMI